MILFAGSIVVCKGLNIQIIVLQMKWWVFKWYITIFLIPNFKSPDGPLTHVMRNQPVGWCWLVHRERGVTCELWEQCWVDDVDFPCLLVTLFIVTVKWVNRGDLATATRHFIWKCHLAMCTKLQNDKKWKHLRMIWPYIDRKSVV